MRPTAEEIINQIEEKTETMREFYAGDTVKAVRVEEVYKLVLWIEEGLNEELASINSELNRAIYTSYPNTEGSVALYNVKTNDES